MFTRLANVRLPKNTKIGVPTIKVQTANRIVFSQEAVTLLKIDAKDRFDVMKATETGKFYISNVGPGKEGRGLSKTNSVTHERISLELGGKGKVYTITDKVVDFDNLDWFELELVNNEDVEQLDLVEEEVELED